MALKTTDRMLVDTEELVDHICFDCARNYKHGDFSYLLSGLYPPQKDLDAHADDWKEYKKPTWAQFLKAESHNPSVMRRSEETDSPTHCCQCRALFPNSLTPDGMEYVREAVLNGDGDKEVYELWRREFDYIDFSDGEEEKDEE